MLIKKQSFGHNFRKKVSLRNSLAEIAVLPMRDEVRAKGKGEPISLEIGWNSLTLYVP